MLGASAKGPTAVRLAFAAAVPLLAVAFLRASGARAHLPFAAAAFAIPWTGAVAACGGRRGSPLLAFAAAIPAMLAAFALGGGGWARLPGALALLLALALAGAGLARLLGSAAALLLLAAAASTPWWVEPILRSLPPGDARARTASLALAANPVAAACDLFETDWLRRETLYAASSIGPDLPVRYPRWTRAALAWATLGLLLARPRSAAAPEPRR